MNSYAINFAWFKLFKDLDCLQNSSSSAYYIINNHNFSSFCINMPCKPNINFPVPISFFPHCSMLFAKHNGYLACPLVTLNVRANKNWIFQPKFIYIIGNDSGRAKSLSILKGLFYIIYPMEMWINKINLIKN